MGKNCLEFDFGFPRIWLSFSLSLIRAWNALRDTQIVVLGLFYFLLVNVVIHNDKYSHNQRHQNWKIESTLVVVARLHQEDGDRGRPLGDGRTDSFLCLPALHCTFIQAMLCTLHVSS